MLTAALATLVFHATREPQDNPLPIVPLRAGDISASSFSTDILLGLGKIEIKDPQGGAATTVDCQFVASPELALAWPSDRPPVEYRRLAVRPGEKAASFEMQSLRGRLDELSSPTAADIESIIGIKPRPNELLSLARLYERGELAVGAACQAKLKIDPLQGLEPGGITLRGYGHAEIDSKLNLELKAKYEWKGEYVYESLGEVTKDLGSWYTPIQQPVTERFLPDGEPGPDRLSELGGLTAYDPQGMPHHFQLPNAGESPAKSRTASQYMGDVARQNGLPWTTQTLGTLGYDMKRAESLLSQMTPRGESMNALDFPEIENPCAADFEAPPGTIWIPSDPSYQTMMTSVRYGYRHQFSLTASLAASIGQQERSMRTLCMNMNLKEPAKSVSYFPYRATDPVVPMLARITDASRFRGAWDQARIWIYMDRATLDQLSEKLVGGMSISGYLMALGDVARAGGLDDKALAGGLFDPSLLAGATAPDWHRDWLWSLAERSHGKTTREYLSRGAPELARLLTPPAAEYGPEYLAELAGRCLTSESAELRKGMLSFLVGLKAAAGPIEGKIGGGLIVAANSDPADQLALLTLVEMSLITDRPETLQFLAEEGKSAAIKAKAKSLLGN